MAFNLPQLFGIGVQQSTRSSPRAGDAALFDNRRQMLRAALRDTLEQYHIPDDWVTVEAVMRASRDGEVRMDVRLVIRHWDADLVLQTLALQEVVRSRIHRLDAHHGSWLTSMSWTFAVGEDAKFPPLRERGATSGPTQPAAVAGRRPRAAAVVAVAAAAEAPARDAGPVVIPVTPSAPTPAEVRAELDRLFARPRDARDAEDVAYAATQPAGLH